MLRSAYRRYSLSNEALVWARSLEATTKLGRRPEPTPRHRSWTTTCTDGFDGLHIENFVEKEYLEKMVWDCKLPQSLAN